MVPKFSTVQTKFIRTTEGILVALFGLAMVVVPVITNSLSATNAAKYGAIVISVSAAARQIAKGISTYQTPFLAPEPPPATHKVVTTTTTVEKQVPEESVKPASVVPFDNSVTPLAPPASPPVSR